MDRASKGVWSPSWYKYLRFDEKQWFCVIFYFFEVLISELFFRIHIIHAIMLQYYWLGSVYCLCAVYPWNNVVFLAWIINISMKLFLMTRINKMFWNCNSAVWQKEKKTVTNLQAALIARDSKLNLNYISLSCPNSFFIVNNFSL